MKKAEAERKQKEEQEAQIRALLIPGAKAGERKTVVINGVEFAFRWCPAGTFTMGSPKSESGPYSNEKQHQVTLTGFWMMETEVPQKLYNAIVNNNPSHFKGDDLPVECVSWYDAVNFCKLCAQYGLKVKLPTEAQWEYASRAGTTGMYAGNLEEMAWIIPNSRIDDNNHYSTHPVRTKKPNAWGLYDMQGNVIEWCLDWFGEYPDGSVTNPSGPSSGSERNCRGSCWCNDSTACRSAFRRTGDPINGNYATGFRYVIVPQS